jgi:hypothetical protein
MKFKIHTAQSTAFVWSATTFPFREILRRKCSTHVNYSANIPVYLVKCGLDLQIGWSVFETSMKILEERAPVWARRMPSLLKTILITDKLELFTYFFADRCCALDPWNVVKHVGNNQTASVLLAGGLIHSMSCALLLEGHCGYLGLRKRRFLSAKAQVRFLKKCLEFTDGLEVQAMINVLNEYADGLVPHRKQGKRS